MSDIDALIQDTQQAGSTTEAKETDFFAEFEQPVQPATPPEELLNAASQDKEPKQETDFFADAEPSQAGSQQQQKYSPEQIRKMNQRISKIITNIWNQAQSFVFGHMVAQTGNTERYMYDSDTVEQLSMLIQDMLPEDKIKIGGGAMVATMIGQQSLANAYIAMEERKANKATRRAKTMKLHKDEQPEPGPEPGPEKQASKEPETDYFADADENDE